VLIIAGWQGKSCLAVLYENAEDFLGNSSTISTPRALDSRKLSRGLRRPRSSKVLSRSIQLEVQLLVPQSCHARRTLLGDGFGLGGCKPAFLAVVGGVGLGAGLRASGSEAGDDCSHSQAVFPTTIILIEKCENLETVLTVSRCIGFV